MCIFRSDRVIRRPVDNMATDHDIDSILSTSNTFCAALMIPFNLSVPIGEITQEIVEHCESGAPCVITGFLLDEDNEQSPFHQSTEWMESIYTNRGRPILWFSEWFL
jgi:hypothetical protein